MEGLKSQLRNQMKGIYGVDNKDSLYILDQGNDLVKMTFQGNGRDITDNKQKNREHKLGGNSCSPSVK